MFSLNDESNKYVLVHHNHLFRIHITNNTDSKPKNIASIPLGTTMIRRTKKNTNQDTKTVSDGGTTDVDLSTSAI